MVLCDGMVMASRYINIISICGYVCVSKEDISRRLVFV